MAISHNSTVLSQETLAYGERVAAALLGLDALYRAESGDEDGLLLQEKRVLFRAAQEGLRNALDHADAGKIELRFERREGHYLLTVSDDGRGFRLPDRLNRFVHENRFGLVGIEEQLQLQGGHLWIDTVPGRGTQLVASLPVAGRER